MTSPDDIIVAIPLWLDQLSSPWFGDGDESLGHWSMDELGAMAVCQVEECDRGWLRMLFSALVWVSLRGVLTWYSIPTSRISALWRSDQG